MSAEYFAKILHPQHLSDIRSQEQIKLLMDTKTQSCTDKGNSNSTLKKDCNQSRMQCISSFNGRFFLQQPMQ